MGRGNLMPASASRDPLATVQAYFDAFSAGDVEGALTLMTSDVVWHVDGDPSVPTVGLLQGRERVGIWLRDFPAHFTPLRFNVDRLLASGDTVVAVGDFRHRLNGHDCCAGSDIAIVFTLRNGLIARYAILEDSLLLARGFDPANTFAEHKVRVNGTVYGYSDRGEGPVVLFLHGLFVDRSIFDAQVGTLASNYRCIALDMPGHGASGWRDEGWTLEDVAADIALMIEQSRWGKVTIVGLSQGGMVALRLAARHPELVSKLILIGTSARAEFRERLPTWTLLRHALLGTAQERLDVFSQLQSRVNSASFLANNPEQAEHERDVMMRNDPQGLTRAIDAAVMRRADIRSLLPAIKCPTLVVVGSEDQATPTHLSEEIDLALPKSELVKLDGVGHHPPIEAPAQLSALVKTFVGV